MSSDGRQTRSPASRASRRGAGVALALIGLAIALVLLFRIVPGDPPPAASDTPDPASPEQLAAAATPEDVLSDAPPTSDAPPPSHAPPSSDAPPPTPPAIDDGRSPVDSEPALLDPDGEPTRAMVRIALTSAIERHDPSLKLSSDELDAATDALWRLREARRELQSLGDDPAHARRRGELVEAIGEATADFTYYVEMTPGELTALDQRDAGLAAPPPTIDR